MIAGCGATSGYDTAALARMIRTSLAAHERARVRFVSCPPRAKRGRGVVIRCSATLADGHVVQLTATQLDDRGTVNLVADEMFADNVERGIVDALARQGVSGVFAVCPEHVRVVIGRIFRCTATYVAAGRRSTVAVRILSRDGSFGLRFGGEPPRTASVRMG
jgi:hypothetical protein